MPKCRGCGADIVFIKSQTGKNMPCDAGLKRGGELKAGSFLINEHGKFLKSPRPFDQGYTPHWATCPNADDFRRSKK